MGVSWCLLVCDTTETTWHFQRGMVEFSVRKYSSMFILSRTAWSHEERARHTGKGSKVVFMQGCGDLTMNLWNVAFVSGDSCYNNYGWDLLHSPDEPLND